MDFSALVDTRVKLVAKVGMIYKDSHTHQDKIVLEDVYINGVFFRDHSHLKLSKRFAGVNRGDVITAWATLIRYLDVDTLKEDKLGFKSVRYIEKIPGL